MPSLNYLNPPPHPFWDFVANMEDHPMFAQQGQPPNYASRDNVNNTTQEQAAQAEPQRTAPEQSEHSKGKQPEGADDPPEVDPSTVQGHGRDHGRRRERCGRARREAEEGAQRFRERGHGWHGRPGRYGPPPFLFGPPGGFGGPWWARHGGPPGPPPPGPHGPHAHHGPHEPHAHGPPHHHGGPRRHSPPRHPHEHPHHRGPPGPGAGFDLGRFLNNLGERIGVDLTGTANDLGINVPTFSAPNNNPEADFEPRTDIFDTPTNYTIHVSLPGGKKEDVGVDWDGEHSVLRIAGVVHRPGVDETLLSQLVVDGRKRETGVFEKAVRLGTKRDPASIDVAGITAKMTDGVLMVKVPKTEREIHRREVPVASATNSPVRTADHEKSTSAANANEKDLLFDADEEMYDAPQAAQQTPAKVAEPTKTQPEKKKEAETMRDDRSETVGHEEKGKRETLPRYEVEEPAESSESEWEKYGSEDEGEYVKINVD